MDAHLHVFAVVAELRNFTRAAEKLHMTQPAVSQQIRALEETFAARLLTRSNKSVSLTRAGEIVLHHAKEINFLYGRMKEMVDELMRHTGGPLPIGASYTFGEYVLPLTLARLNRDYPGIRPSIAIGNTADIAERVRSRDLEVGIVEGEDIGSGLMAEKLAEDEMYVAAGIGHPLAASERIEPAELEKETWLVREPGSGTRAATDRMFAEFGLRPRRLMELGSTQLIKEAVEAGLGITLQSGWALRKELRIGSLRLLPVSGMPVRRSFHVLFRSGDLRTRTLEVFLETLRDVTGKAPPGSSEEGSAGD
ncbi:MULTISPECIES: LysR family transcriptional regulator [Cohnella]|uniref:LysR family transcriptional regulator n=1 Tax=Cohnella TaxID=329857 RepID=UPI0009BC40D8|nr:MULTISPECIES: LysR family transcriptional regulator [Cohnella]MBN2980774.1 LysR family transcriptional regulator [Cohnella algarum]